MTEQHPRRRRTSVADEGRPPRRTRRIREAGALLVAAGAVDAGVRRRDARARELRVHLHGQLPRDPARHERGEGCHHASALSLVRYDEPIDWDGDEVRFAVGIAGMNNEHLEILSKIAIVFSDEDEVQKLLDAPDADELFALLGEVNAE